MPPEVKLGVVLISLAMLSGCGDMAKVPILAGTGPQPTLEAPRPSLIPTINIAPASGWPIGMVPIAAPGTQVQAFAKGLDHPRWLQLLPNGDVLVAESNAPERPQDGEGIKGWIATHIMRRAGAVTVSANRITLLRDTNGDGVADWSAPLLTGLNSPFGMALVGGYLYVANTDALMRFPYATGDTHMTDPGTKVLDLPAGPINHHWTKSLIDSPDGKTLYVTVGSNSNVAGRGMAVEEGRAAIWEYDIATGAHRVFAWFFGAHVANAGLGATHWRFVDSGKRA